MRLAVSALVVAVAVVGLAACEDEVVFERSTDFDGFVLEVADSLALGDVERLVSNTVRVEVECDERLVEEAKLCQGVPVGGKAQGFDVSFFGRDVGPLDGDEFRLLLEGMMFGADLQAPADDFGAPGLQTYSTLFPDPVVWFSSDDPENLPSRGDIAITYIGRSPSEDDQVQRRLWTAVAEQDDEGVWRIRLWLVGFFQADHPALNPSEENMFKRWSPPQ